MGLTRDSSGELIVVPGLAGPLDRSAFGLTTGTTDARQQLNQITPQVDAADLSGAAILDPTNAAITTEFLTATFRFVQTMVASQLSRSDEDGTSISDLTLAELFFNFDALKQDGIAHLKRGADSINAQVVDTRIIDDLNFFLTSPRGVTGLSLAALNILLGRDYGLPDWRRRDRPDRRGSG